MATELIIFCDGGLGNRMNALFSGVALARILGAKFRVGWPVNSWCGARFEDVFSAPCEIDDRLLSEHCLDAPRYRCFTHDALSASALGAQFLSAYGFSSVDEFAQQLASDGGLIFFYPALIPDWIPREYVLSAIKSLPIRDALRTQALAFLFNDLALRPFYGIHLRRTDLNTGYSDDEVDRLTRQYSSDTFFLCSDDPRAEKRGACNPNICIRRKSSYVERKSPGFGWQAPTKDGDGRVYYSNIYRSSESIREAVVDMLVLGHGEVLNVGGSTFRRMAQMLVQAVPVVRVPRLVPIDYASLGDYSKLVAANSDPSTLARNFAKKLEAENRSDDAIKILKQAVSSEGSSDAIGVMAEIGKLYFGLNELVEAKLWYQAALHLDPGNTVLRGNLEVVDGGLDRASR